MKKLIVLLIAILMTSGLLSCKSEPKLTDFESLVQIIYDSESTLVGYTEIDSIKEADLLVYEKKIEFSLERLDEVKTTVSTIEKILSDSGSSQYETVTANYYTIGNTKYQEVSGQVYESEYTIPTYYLTFMLAEEYLAAGYELAVNGNDYSLKGDILDDKISAFFLNKSLITVTNLKIEIEVIDAKLQSLKATYLSTNGFPVEMMITYRY